VNASRVTFSLTERSRRALALAIENGGDNQTDTVNRAIQVYSYLLFEKDGDPAARIELRKSDGSTERLNLLL
jgi:hypothetical protein